jgi:hypothetical protein
MPEYKLEQSENGHISRGIAVSIYIKDEGGDAKWYL